MNRSDDPRCAPLPSTGSGTVRIYGVVLSVGVCCSLAIVSTYELTRPLIERNRVSQRERAVADVLPTATRLAAFAYREDSRRFAPNRFGGEMAERVYAGFDQEGQLVGVVLETEGMGYQDAIRLLYAYVPSRQAITGIRILESRETPGLGDRIESDAAFQENFDQLDVTLAGDGEALAHPLEFVKPGAKGADWQIDGITGATISSRAVADMLRRSTARWIPRVHARRHDFHVPQTSE